MKALQPAVELFLVVFAGAFTSLWDLVGAVEYETNYCRCEQNGEDLYGRTYITSFLVVEGITVIPWYHAECRHHIMYPASVDHQTDDYVDPNYHRHLYQQRQKETAGATQAAKPSRSNNEKQRMRNLVEDTASGLSRRTKRKEKKRRATEGKKKLYTVGHRRLPLYQKQSFKGYHHWTGDLFSDDKYQKTGYDIYSYDKSQNVFRCPTP
jgi:hypothetical protein